MGHIPCVDEFWNPWKILGANIRRWAKFPWFFQKNIRQFPFFYKNVSPKFYNIKLFYVNNRQHYIENIYNIIINLYKFTNTYKNIS